MSEGSWALRAWWMPMTGQVGWLERAPWSSSLLGSAPGSRGWSTLSGLRVCARRHPARHGGTAGHLALPQSPAHFPLEVNLQGFLSSSRADLHFPCQPLVAALDAAPLSWELFVQRPTGFAEPRLSAAVNRFWGVRGWQQNLRPWLQLDWFPLVLFVRLQFGH